MNGIIVEGNTLTIGHTKIIVKYPIKKIEKINGKYIVLLKIPRVELGVDELNNILCYDEQGIMCWQISNKLPSNIVSKEQIPYIAMIIKIILCFINQCVTAPLSYLLLHHILNYLNI